MAGIVAHHVPPVISGNTNPNISTELNDIAEAVTVLSYYDSPQPGNGRYSVERMPSVNTWAISATKEQAFKGDYYERIHILPSRIELGTVASNVTREIAVWNAYTTQSAQLGSIDIQNGSGISVTGADVPLEFMPLQELTWEVRITPNGPPEIDARILFDFADVEDPLPVVIIGNRAVVLPAVPDVPVTERWRWLTDTHVSYDGTEQRVCLRNLPRRTMSTRLRFESEAEVREQYKTLLSAVGRLFIPYFQYATTIKAASVAGDTVLTFDTAYVDLRPDDYVLLLTGSNAVLVQLDTIGASSANTKAPLSINVPVGTKVVAIFASILPNNLNLSRGAVNNYATMSMSSDATYPRAVVRPGSTAGYNSLDGYFLLERRPLANDDIDHAFDTGQEILDGKTGLFDVMTNWDFTKVESDFSFLVRRLGRYACQHRTGIDEMDYWRLFCDTMKGSFNTFLLASYRPDQVLASAIAPGTDSMVFSGPTYADNFWPAMAYHYIAVFTDKGIHYAKVTAVTKTTEGDSAITFAPSLPTADGWQNVKQVSYVLKQRIADDEVEWDHYQLDSIIKFRTRTVKE